MNFGMSDERTAVMTGVLEACVSKIVVPMSTRSKLAAGRPVPRVPSNTRVDHIQGRRAIR
ncbi:hypothetical protein C7S13_7456 [Burkholderia cepacia]|nr:hypothetical protein [Burkholderia cepacia]